MQINIFDIKNHRNPLVETEKICSNILRHLEKKFEMHFLGISQKFLVCLGQV